jgi:hypothetical protein
LLWNSTKNDTFRWCAWRESKQDDVGKLESLYSPLGLRNVEISSSTRVDTHDVPGWPFYIHIDWCA